MDVEAAGRATVPGYFILVAMLSLFMLCGSAIAEPVWVVEPDEPGPDLPPRGRSLFDHLTSRDGHQVVPYPYEALLELVRSRLDADTAYLGTPLKQVLIPLGRSLQREAAAPGFFQSPRIVTVVDSEPRSTADDPGMLLRDRLYIAYLEAADVLEVISYNESAARFEFQVVTDYRDGETPRVRYARRLVCTACHQNAAPLFARPLWDETNSNTEISRQLMKLRSVYHEIPSKVGVDIAYAIDNATDRANEFSLTQKLWQDGCGGAETGARCRAALLTRALQYTLSGQRGFDTVSATYRQQLHNPMLEARNALWPDGFKLPNPDIPNRRPLRANRASASPVSETDTDSMLRQADISAGFEPLAPRPPLGRWNPDPDTWIRRAVQGLTQFLASDDARRIDEQLALSPAESSTHTATCKVSTGTGKSSTERLKIHCLGEALAFRGMLYHDPSDNSLHGQLRGLRVQDDDLGVVLLSGHRLSETVWQLALDRADTPYRVRRSNADEVSALELHWQGTERSEVVARLTIRHDGHSLGEAANHLILDRGGVLSKQPFQRARVMPALYASLGLEPLRWCCVGPTDLPAPETESAATPLESGRLSAFLKACAGCHRSDAPFPPNFLAGTEERVLETIAHCGERIQYRLAMWDQPRGKRTKSPMPPTQSLSMHENEGRHWMSGMLPELRKALHDISAAASRPLPSMQVTVARPYFDLRPCLPTS